MNNLIVEQQIKDVLEEARSFFVRDGGDITYVSFENGIVTLRLHGACAVCPVSTLHLKVSVEELLKQRLPQVLGLCVIE